MISCEPTLLLPIQWTFASGYNTNHKSTIHVMFHELIGSLLGDLKLTKFVVTKHTKASIILQGMA
jgi:hypothetical protein